MVIIHNEEAMITYLRSVKRPFTKFMPVEVEGWTYNARTLQQVYKLLTKSGIRIEGFKVTENGRIEISYVTTKSKGMYTLRPFYPKDYNGPIGKGSFYLTLKELSSC